MSADKMTDVAKKVQQKAEQLIIKDLPENILKLNELLETLNFADIHRELNIPVPLPAGSDDSDVNEPKSKRPRKSSQSSLDGIRVHAVASGSVPSNKLISDLIHLVKPRIRELVKDSNLMKTWISFVISKIDDGNKVSKLLLKNGAATIQSAESEAAAFFDKTERYFFSRAEIVSKVAQSPHIEDYRRAIRELDEKAYLALWLEVREIRNSNWEMRDFGTKVLEQIRKPRSQTETQNSIELNSLYS